MQLYRTEQTHPHEAVAIVVFFVDPVRCGRIRNRHHRAENEYGQKMGQIGHRLKLSRNPPTSLKKRCGCSACSQCPAFLMVTSRALGKSS